MRVRKARLISRVQLPGIGNIGGDQVTEQRTCTTDAPEQAQQSLSGLLDTPELLRVRILPAQFAKALGVSKQSVSRWCRDGWVTLAADGRLDPTVAIGQLLRRCDPGRLRARWLRQAVTEVQELREAAATADQRVAAVADQLADVKRQLDHMLKYAADADCMIDRVLELVRDSELALRATANSDEWNELVDRLEGAAVEACDPEGCALDALSAAAADALDALTARDAATPEGAGND